MRPPMSIDPGAEVGAWIAAGLGAFTLGRQIIDTFRKRRKEKEDLDQALDRTPQIKQQLELGNIGEAIKHLNDIIESEVAARLRAERVVDDLEQDLDVTKNRADQAEEKSRQCEEKALQEQRLRIQAETELATAKRSFARTVARLRRSSTSDDEEGK